MDGFPDPWAGVLHGYEQLGAFLDVTQIGHEIRTDWTRRQMLLLLVAAAPVNDVRQDFLKLYTRHGRLFSLESGLAQSLEVSQDLSLRTWFTFPPCRFPPSHLPRWSSLSLCCPLCLAKSKKLTQFHARFVQLRLAVADGAAHHLGNLIVLVAFYIVQHKYDTVPWRQTLDGALQVHAIEGTGQYIVTSSHVLPRPIFLLRLQRFLQRHFGQAFLAQMHKHHVHRQPMQPGRKCRLATEGCDFPKQLQEGFLCKVFRFRGVACHAQTQRIDTALVKAIQSLKTLGVALLGPLDGFLLGHAAGQYFLRCRQFPCLKYSWLHDSMRKSAGMLPLNTSQRRELTLSQNPSGPEV